jgi:hypothetical protein
MEDEGNDILHAHQFISVCQLIRGNARQAIDAAAPDSRRDQKVATRDSRTARGEATAPPEFQGMPAMRRELINLFGEAGAVTAAAERGTNRAGCLCDVLLIHPPTLRWAARLPAPAQQPVRNLRSRHKSSQRVEWGGILCCVHITPRAPRELCSSHHSHSAWLHYYCCCLACDNCHCESSE